MFFRHLKTGLLLTAIAGIFGCSEPPVPPEVQLAASQEQDLWGSGAAVYAPAEYQHYRESLQTGRTLLRQEQDKWRLVRNYTAVQQSFNAILAEGNTVKALSLNRQHQENDEIRVTNDQLRAKIDVLRQLSASLKDSRLARRKLTESEVLLHEASGLLRNGRNDQARTALKNADAGIEAVVGTIAPLVSRFADTGQIDRWRTQVRTAVSASKRQGGNLIVIEKLERRLTLYHNGLPQHTYPAGLGFNFLSMKLRSGDKATPEGHYRVIRKVPASRYVRALLLDYPNENDRQRFNRARKDGTLPAGARIGGLIEIHGGGKDGMTDGCIALEDHQMSDLFGRVEVGTPVVIVGTLDPENIVVTSLKELL